MQVSALGRGGGTGSSARSQRGSPRRSVEAAAALIARRKSRREYAG
jgi:hypothetical protein